MKYMRLEYACRIIKKATQIKCNHLSYNMPNKNVKHLVAKTTDSQIPYFLDISWHLEIPPT